MSEQEVLLERPEVVQEAVLFKENIEQATACYLVRGIDGPL